LYRGSAEPEKGVPVAGVSEAPSQVAASVGAPETAYGKLAPGPGMAADEVAAHQCVRIHLAMVNIVAERGYSAVKVRELVEAAGVSTRAFYEHFESKEDCFLRTYETLTRRAARRIIASQAGERDWRKRSRLIFDEFLRGLESQPHAARFALIEAYEAGPAALEQARRSERTFEAMLGESLARAPGGIVVPPLVMEGMAGGISHVARARLRVGREAELRRLEGPLIDWALSYPGQPAAALAELDLQTVWRNTAFEPLATAPVAEEGEAWHPTGDRGLILSAVAELAVANGYGKLTVTRIRSRAGVSRRIFSSHFDGVEDCFVAALEQRAGEALAQAARAQTAGRTWPGGIYRAVAALCDQIADDPFLARVCLVDDFAPGSRGARCRRRLLAGFAEQFADSVPPELRPDSTTAEATAGAIWSLFHRHIVRDWAQQRKAAATLAFFALAPVVGASAAVAAIRREQTA
jgi:AcrR family transcriptional regulator